MEGSETHLGVAQSGIKIFQTPYMYIAGLTENEHTNSREGTKVAALGTLERLQRSQKMRIRRGERKGEREGQEGKRGERDAFPLDFATWI